MRKILLPTDEVVLLYRKAMWTVAQLAEKFGVTKFPIRRCLTQAGIKLRPQREEVTGVSHQGTSHFKHGHAYKPGKGGARTRKPTAEYTAWLSMKSRCYYEKNIRFHLYGARGITVCDRWRNSFENFLADVGRKPTPKHSLDRWPRNDGNYEPGNVRWATASQQMKNRRDFERSKRTAQPNAQPSIFD